MSSKIFQPRPLEDSCAASFSLPLRSERVPPPLTVSLAPVSPADDFFDESPDCLVVAPEGDEPELDEPELDEPELDEPELDEFELDEFGVVAAEDAELLFPEFPAAVADPAAVEDLDDESEFDWLPCMAGEVRLALSTGSSSSVQSLRGLSLSVMAHASSPCRPQPYCRRGDCPGHGRPASAPTLNRPTRLSGIDHPVRASVGASLNPNTG